MKNKLADFFNSSTELSAIDHFLQLMVKNNTFDQKMKLLQEQFQHSEQLQSEYLKRMESLIIEKEIKEKDFSIQLSRVGKLNDQYKYELKQLKKQLREKSTLQPTSTSIQLKNTINKHEILKEKTKEYTKKLKANELKISTTKNTADIINSVSQNEKKMFDSMSELEHGVWVDPDTGLMWARISVGQTWKNGRHRGAAKWIDWNKAENVCKKMRLANFTDWRLPTVGELTTLMKRNQSGYLCPTDMLIRPTIHTWGFYWSCSRIEHQTIQGIDFDKGCLTNYDSYRYDAYIRAVRSNERLDNEK